MLAPSTGRSIENADALRRRITFRLLITQYDDGQWRGENASPANTSSLYPIADMRRAQSNFRRKAQQPDWNLKGRWEERRWYRYGQVCRLDDGRYSLPADLYPTLASLVFLTSQLDQPITMEGAAILPPERTEDGVDGDSQAGGDEPTATGSPRVADESDTAPEQADPLTPDLAASSVQRINLALPPLLEHVRTCQNSAMEP